ncbi:DNA polymerase delta subunit 3 [Ooceraea biroi]|uniref:DNA polymerase delta subunit 3 n=1 Tax=Ooceraea biroi TaxID=2015173 RepID=UPI0005B965F1|nr:DNA polymerase delta subunit 3 [Ooceraea biroi]XP_026823887.1 DNA polymerase delta subunit 3 [Ooceraea biroi]
MEALNEQLETLTSHVFDNDKLVTYKWLSKILKVHVNTAKQILWAFYEKYHESHNIECTYLLIGLLNDNEMRVEVIKGSDLLKAREKFRTIISEHLYSVHKPLEDLELLASSDPGDINYSAIKCDACKERSDEEMQLLRWGTVARKAVPENVVNANTTDVANRLKVEKNLITKKNNGVSTLFRTSGKSKNSEETKPTLQKKDKALIEKDETSMQEAKGLAEKQDDSPAKEDKNSTKKSEKSDEVSKDKSSKKVQNSTERKKSSTKKISPKNKPMKSKGLDNFFEKRTSPPQPVKTVSSEKNDDKTNTEVTKEIETKEEKKELRGKKRNRSKDISQSTKKRKRVVVQSDSSDSEVQSDAEMEDAVPELEAEPLVRTKSPSPPRMKHENGKKKVLKLVNKVYKENGYIVTKKEHVYVSCSEDEEEKKEEEERRKKKVETKTEKVKKKQSTLTDFFKKS